MARAALHASGCRRAQAAPLALPEGAAGGSLAPSASVCVRTPFSINERHCSSCAGVVQQYAPTSTDPPPPSSAGTLHGPEWPESYSREGQRITGQLAVTIKATFAR